MMRVIVVKRFIVKCLEYDIQSITIIIEIDVFIIILIIRIKTKFLIILNISINNDKVSLPIVSCFIKSVLILIK